MSRILFFEQDDKNIIKYNEHFFEIDTENKDELNELITKYNRGDTLTYEEKEILDDLFSEMKFIDDTEMEFYEINSICDLNLNDSNKKICMVKNLNIENLKTQFTTLFNTVVIIVFENHYLITPVINSQTNEICMQCIINRYVESQPMIYKYQYIYDLNESDEICQIDKDILCKMAKLKFKENNRIVTIVDKNTWKVQYSEIISREGCLCCYGNEKKHLNDFEINNESFVLQDSGKRNMSVESALKKLSVAVNILGPVIELVESSNIDKIDMTVFQSESAHDPLRKYLPYHGGKGLTASQAKCSAIAEAIERYSARMFGNEHMIEGSFNDISKIYKNILDPKAFELKDDFIFSYSDNKNIDWVEGKKISTNETYIIPANVVFFLYDPIEVDKQFIPQSTTGLSAGMTIEDAILQGLCEIIERDSYIVYYRNQLKTQTVKLDSIKNSNLLNLINELSLKNIKIHIKYLKNETQVYVMHCVTEDVSGEFPIYTHGVGASTNPEVAIIRAITEAIQMRVSQIEVNKNYEQFKDDSSFEAYMTWGNGDKLKVGNLLHEDGDEIVLLSSLKFSNYSSLKEEILDIVNTLDKSGYDVYVCNLSRNDTPAYVVRVIIPGYQDGIHAFNRITHRMKKLPELLNQDCRVPLFDEVLFT